MAAGTPTDQERTCPVEGCGRQFKSYAGRLAHQRANHPETDPQADSPTTDPEDTGPVESPPQASADDQPAPKRPRRKLRDRVRGRGKRDDEPTDMGKERAPRSTKWGKTTGRTGGRTSIAELVSTGYALVGPRLAKTNQYPVGRALQLQAPYIGTEIDNVIKGTPVDHLVQPVARVFGTGANVSKLTAFPVLVGAYHNFPAMRPFLDAPLESAIRANCVEMAKEIRRLKVEDEKLRQAFEESIPDIFPNGIPTDEATGKPIDIVRGIMVDLFGPPTQEATPNDNGTGHAAPAGQPEPAHPDVG